MGFVPTSINNQDFLKLVDSYRICLDTKGTVYYNRIAGGMKYSNSDLLRLELIISLLNSSMVREGSIGLNCIFDEIIFPGVLQENFSEPKLPSAGHLQSFLNFASEFCKDCITSTPVTPVGTAVSTANKLFSETGTEITLESGSSIILY